MRMFSLSEPQRYGVAIIGVAVAAAVRMVLDPLLGDELPLFLFTFPVILAAWFGGLWPGLLATALSLALGDYLFIAPRGTLFYYRDLLTLNRVSYLFFFGLVISILAEGFRGSIKAEMDSLRQEKAAREEAETADRLKDEFLATISHELRTPLTSILGWARLFSSGSVPDNQARQAMDVIAESAQAQAQLIDDILDTSRIITGRFQLDAQPVEIECIFQAVIDVVRPNAELKGVALNTMIDARREVVLGDADRLRQAIWNLLSNAVKFSNEGGRVEARLARAGKQIEITVSDTGVGIDSQFMPHIFERFRQADGARTRGHGGLGLGLAITRHIVEMHGGDVSASSPGKGQGATFKIRLPLTSTASASRAQSAERQRPVLGGPQEKETKAAEGGQRLDGLRILVVEDNPDTLEMLSFIFEERGAEVITAASVPEALEALERRIPDAIVSDIAMPEQDGYELIRQVRERGPEQGGGIPAVAITAYAGAEDRVRALSSGFQMHLAKPVDPNEMIAVMASLTGRIRM
jgi:signal transduction histidine kinase/CheY-like chemotaxis protein